MSFFVLRKSVFNRIPVLDPPVDPDSLDDELAVPQDPTPVVASGSGKCRTGTKRVTLADVMKQEAAKP